MTARVAPAPPGTLRGDALGVGTASRRVLWGLLVSLQLFNALQLALFASIYFTRNTRGSLLWTASIYFLFADAYVFVDRHHLVVAVSYTLLGVAFAVSGLRLLYLSMRSRRLRFGTSARLKSRVLARSRSELLRIIFLPVTFHEWKDTSRRRRTVEWIDTATFTVGIHGPLFHVRYATTRIIGIAAQTIAAYSSSRSISNVSLNVTYGGVLFLSCVSAPIWSTALPTKPLRQRLAYLVSDLLLDFVWGSVVPLWMYTPILYMFYTDSAETMVDTSTSAREIRRVLVLSWWNLALSVVPFVNSLFSSLEILQVLSSRPAGTSKPLGPPSTSVSKSATHGTSDVDTVHKSVRWWSVIAKAVAIAYGCAILVITISANDVLGHVKRQPHFPCLFRLHPWFSTKEACVKRYVNCTSVDIEGNVAEIEAALDLFDGDSLSDLHIQSCSALEIPPVIHHFSSLTSLAIEDSWIVDWPLSAAITQDLFSGLKTIKLLSVDTNSTLHGLVSVPIAQSIEYIRFYDVPNAETILQPVGSNWQHLKYFDCDDCSLPDVPLAVDSMHQLLTLSLAGSRITNLRDDWIAKWNLQLIGLWMDETPELTTLSDVVWRQASVSSMFSMQFTNLSSIPAWVPSVARADFVVYAHGSPLCDTDRTVLGSESIQVRKLVSCEYNEG